MSRETGWCSTTAGQAFPNPMSNVIIGSDSLMFVIQIPLDEPYQSELGSGSA